MKRNIFILLSVFVTVCFFSPAVFAEKASDAEQKSVIDESVEPQSKFILEINDKKFELQKGASLKIQGEFKDPTVKVEVEPFKEFTYGGIYLQYPQHFTFESDLGDENVKMWNLSGNSGILMIQKYSLEMDHNTMAHLLQPRYGEQNARIAECSMKIDGTEVPGTVVIANFGGATISQEVYSFKVKGDSVLLILQDSLDPKGNPTAEGLALKEIVGKTFKIEK
ncbi:MAG: hypothetical protein PWR01_3803 [Clostridiales bacterium]|nr:hypothetical protein [Clostridiales bacterium]MDN5282730.1 hypothetical protein [Candidatus Ozemobacter sp.]